MLYIVLKTIIETSITQYTCQNCQGKVNESSISVGHANENAIDLTITCPHCASQTQIHAEIANMNHEFLESDEGKEVIQKAIKKSENTIKDTDIESLSKTLSETRSIEDLLK